MTITIIGTSHISPESKREVENTIRALRPSIVAVELDRGRLKGLTNKNQKRATPLSTLRHVGLTGFLFALIGSSVMNYLSKKLGTTPGEDMLGAVRVGKEIGARLALIDQDVAITLKNISCIPRKEKARFIWDIISSPFTPRYPHAYKALVTDRNIIMAERLAKLQQLHGDERIVAVVGAGREEELRDTLRKQLTVKATESKQKQ